jgi:hypothetical protein
MKINELDIVQLTHPIEELNWIGTPANVPKSGLMAGALETLKPEDIRLYWSYPGKEEPGGNQPTS